MLSIKKKSNVLVLAAHADDETLGCGGTIARLSHELKCNVDVIFFTDGVSSRFADNMRELADVRREHAKNACEILGVRKTTFLNFPDNAMDGQPLLDVARAIEESLHGQAYDAVLTHTVHCLNVDHTVVSRAATVVFRDFASTGCRQVLHFEVPSSTEWTGTGGFVPNCYVDIESSMIEKLDALEEYAHEIRGPEHPRNRLSVEIYAQRAGLECGCKHAERFMLVRGVV